MQRMEGHGSNERANDEDKMHWQSQRQTDEANLAAPNGEMQLGFVNKGTQSARSNGANPENADNPKGDGNSSARANSAGQNRPTNDDNEYNLPPISEQLPASN